MKTKLGSAQVAAVVAKGAAMVRTLLTENAGLHVENTELREKVASFERRDRITKLAGVMEEKGLNSNLTFEEKIDQLAKADLDRVEDAVKMASNHAISMAEVADRQGSSTLDPLTEACLE